MLLLLRELSRHLEKSCYFQAGDLITAREDFCLGRGNGLCLPHGEGSRNGSVPVRLDHAAPALPCPGSPTGIAPGVQAEPA